MSGLLRFQGLQRVGVSVEVKERAMDRNEFVLRVRV